ncbi:MAG TPA: ABC transporter ATP-binding protein [bacterium]|nr:ABC transporter ATP-binding protein [bacterium]
MESAYYEDDKQADISSRKALGHLLPLLRAHRGWLLVCLALLAASKGIYLLGPNLIRHAIDVDITGRNYRGLVGTVGLYILVQGLFLVINYFFRLRMEIIGQKVMIVLRKQLFDHVIRTSISFFDRNPAGRLMARIESDTEALRLMFTNTVVAMIGSLFLIAGMFIWMSIVSWRLTLVVAILVPVISTALYFYHRVTTPMWLVIRKRMADVTASLAEFLQGMEVIQIFDRAREVRRRMNEINYRKYRPQAKAEIIVTVMFNFIFFMETFIVALVLYFGARWVGVAAASPAASAAGAAKATGALTIGTLVMFISYVRMFFEPVYLAAEEIASVQRAVAGAKRIFGLLSVEENIPEPVHPVRWSHFDSELVFENVWFSYTNDENWALRDVSFRIPKGQRFALAGVTGGGKSTVINLLLRFYDPQRGRILVDGTDIREIATADLRRKFGLVLQDIFIFPGNVASNVSLEARGYDMTRVAEACRMVSADRFIESMPDKYETELSERGANLSRGERQLLSFARALAFDPEILILDEATSSVDPETERLIQDGLATLMRGRTSIVIAHRLSTILNVDRILVIRDGEIIERGTHDQLVEAGGYYSKLFKLQFLPANGLEAKK